MKPGERKDGVGLEREYSLFFSWLWQVASGWHFLKKKYYWKIKYTKRKIFRPADSLCKWLQGLELSPNEAGSRSLLLSRGFLYCFEMIHVVEKKIKSGETEEKIDAPDYPVTFLEETGTWITNAPHCCCFGICPILEECPLILLRSSPPSELKDGSNKHLHIQKIYAPIQ